MIYDLFIFGVMRFKCHYLGLCVISGFATFITCCIMQQRHINSKEYPRIYIT